MANNVNRFISLQTLFNFLFAVIILVSLNMYTSTALAKKISDVVVKIKPPFDIELKKNGTVRLAGLLYNPEFVGLDHYIQTGSRVFLEDLSLEEDRYQRKSAHIFLSDGRWLQALLVQNDMIIPYPHLGEEGKIRDLYQFEQKDTFIKAAPDIKTDQFAIVEGRVFDVALFKDKVYLNFEENWRTDFTVLIEKSDFERFIGHGIDFKMLKNKEIRIRGWVFNKNGPMIKLTTPYALELIKE